MPATNGIIQFKYGLQEKYNSLATKDLNTIYFTTDEQRLFVGDVEYSRPVGHGTSLPAAFVPANSMFVVENGTRRELHYSKDGSAWDLIAVLPAEITAGIVGANTAGAVDFGGTIKIPKITYDKHGNITAAEDVEVVLPSETPVDVEAVKQGDGNAVTEITANGGTITYKMGATFATAAAAAAAQKTADDALAMANEAATDAETAQGEVDALEAIVEANESDIEGKMTALTTRVSTNESNISKKQDALEFNTAYNKDTNKVATMTDVTNAVAGLSGAMHFKGVISNLPATAEAGDVYLVGNKEYVWDDTQGKFVELGDETIYAVKGNIKDADIAADAAIAQSKIAGLTALAGQVNTNKEDITNLKNNKQDTVTFNTAYDANTNKAATMADVNAAALVWQTL